MTPNFTHARSDDPLASDQSPVLLHHHRVALKALLLLLSVAAPLVTLGLYTRDGATALTGVGFSLSLFIWLALFVFQMGKVRLAAHIVVGAVLIASVVGTVAQGSVRSSAVLVMLAGVVAAGSFLPRASLTGIAVLCALALAVLNWMESSNLLPAPNLKTGWSVWVTQVSVLASMLVSVFYGRLRLMGSFEDQETALRLAQDAQADLLASQDRFKALFRNNPAACLVQHASTHEVLDVNEALTSLFGYQREDLLGKPPPPMWANEREFQMYRQALLQHGRVSGLRATALRQDGTRFASMVNAEVVKQGDQFMIIAMVVDLSVEEAARLALTKSEDRFSKAFNFSPLGMTITRLSDGKFMEVNPANERVLGYSAEDFKNRTSMSASVWLSQDDRDRYVNTLRAQGHLAGYETRMRNHRGQATDVKVWAQIIEIEGDPCALSYTMNITEEKQREAMLLDMAKGVSGETGEPFFRSLVIHMAQTLKADLVISGEINQPGVVQTVAACFEGHIVPNIQYKLEGTPCSHAVDTAGGQYFYADRLAERFPGDDFPIGGGFETYVGVALRDADGTPIGILKALWTRHQQLSPDVQALLTIFSSRCNAELIRLRRDREIERLRETLEQRVLARTAQLEYVNRELDAFAYSVSHDLKSPLRSIDGFMHVLHEQMGDRLTEADRALIAKVSASVARMNGLITDLLSLARVSQGQLQRMQVDLSDLAQGVVRQERHRDPTHEVDIVIAPGLSANCDPRLAQIVLENLLGNAWKYSHHRARPRIEFALLPTQDASVPVFSIKDNGAGFDMSRADRLFKPFNRLHSANEFEGSGIGLATVRRIIERHGGHIAGEGVVGQGSMFTFSFGSGSAD